MLSYLMECFLDICFCLFLLVALLLFCCCFCSFLFCFHFWTNFSSSNKDAAVTTIAVNKRKNLKAETIKRLSPRSKRYCFSHSRVSRIQRFFLSTNHGSRQYFSVFYSPSLLKFISPALLSYYY